MDKMREEFEDFMEDSHWSWVGCDQKEELYKVWKASRVALRVDLPSKINDRNDSFSCGFDSAISSAEVSLENAGVSYK